MFDTLKSLLGISPKVNYTSLIKNGAKVIDVRTRGEFAAGHVENSINIPLNELADRIRKINQDTVIVTCCASGLRSASAKSVLKSLGYKEVYNGGGWASLENKIKELS